MSNQVSPLNADKLRIDIQLLLTMYMYKKTLTMDVLNSSHNLFI